MDARPGSIPGEEQLASQTRRPEGLWGPQSLLAKECGCKANHSSASNTEVMNAWNDTPTIHVCLVWCFIKVLEIN